MYSTVWSTEHIRAGTVVQEVNLSMRHEQTCFTFSFAFSFTLQVYQCADKRCITAEQVCDLINDCGHWEEEENCVNHYKCSSAPLKFIRHEQVCNFYFIVIFLVYLF